MKTEGSLPLGASAYFFSVKFRPSISGKIAIKKGAPQTPGKSKIRRFKEIFGETDSSNRNTTTEELVVVVCPENTKIDVVTLWAIAIGWEKAGARELLALSKAQPFLHKSMNMDSVVVSATEDHVVEGVRMVSTVMWSRSGREAGLGWIENLSHERRACFLFRKKRKITSTRCTGPRKRLRIFPTDLSLLSKK